MDMQRVDSSNIEAVGYDPVTSEMHVRFTNGNLYAYKGVSAETHQDLMAADSPGSHLHEFVKGQHEYEKLE
jgi:hypothetical protein